MDVSRSGCDGTSGWWIAAGVQKTVTESASIAKVGAKKTRRESLSLSKVREEREREMFLEGLV